MQNYIEHALESFQHVFSRTSTWLLFCAIVIGFMGAGEMIGVTRSVVSGYWMKTVITACSIFFRSESLSLWDLAKRLANIVLNQDKTVKVAERAVLLAIIPRSLKDGRKMPGVVSIHEESETQSKPSYFRGQCWGALGLLIGTLSACFCCPLQLQIHQGFTHLGLTGESGSQSHIKSTERMVAMAVDFAESHQCLSYLVLDAFFSAGSVFRARDYYSIEHKKPWLKSYQSQK